MQALCEACGAPISDERTCQDDFYQMLYWEHEFPALGVVHHLMVISYHLQHPHLYSPQGLNGIQQQLKQFIETDITPEQMRQGMRQAVDSGKRNYAITARPGSYGQYDHPMPWTLHACDVVAGGAENYIQNTHAWAQSIYSVLKQTGELT